MPFCACTKKHVLPLTCSFFNWFLVSNIYLVVITAVSNRCFEWRGLMYEEGGTWFVGGLGPPPPHPPPIARRLFIGFQNVPCSKSNFQRSKLKFQWLLSYKKSVSLQNWVFKIKLPLLKTKFSTASVRVNLDSLMVRFSSARDCGSIPHQDSTVSMFFCSFKFQKTLLTKY